VLVSHKYKFIYTKTVKTAGTSVESYFEKFCMDELRWKESQAREFYESEHGIIGYRGGNADNKKWFHHMPAKTIKEYLGSEIWDSYFKFSVIRNPFDKMVSYFYFINKQFIQADKNTKIASFREWLKNEKYVLDRDKYVIDKQLCIDYFIRFEDLQKGVSEVCKILNIPYEPKNLPKFKYGNRINDFPLSEYYDDFSRKHVADVYKHELETFGYSFPE